MIQKLKKNLSFSILILSVVSCVCHQTKFGTRTEIFDKKDSLKSLARIKEIKNLDYSDFKAGKFDNGKVVVNYRLLKPKNLNQNKKYPLVVVFHGSGAVGTNNTSQMGVLSKM